MSAREPTTGRRRLLSASWSGAVLTFYAAALLLCAMALPWWRMDSRAPQYGQRVLVVDVSPTGVHGDIKELDGLGHYIGMRTLSTPSRRSSAGSPPTRSSLVALGALALPFVRSRRLRVALAALVVAVPIGFVADLWAWQQFAVTHLDPTAALNMIANRVQARVSASTRSPSSTSTRLSRQASGSSWSPPRTCSASSSPSGPRAWAAPRATPGAAPTAMTAGASAAALLLLLGSPPASAATLEVGAGARYTSIGEAIRSASAGDEIVVHAGVYREHLTIDRALVLRAEGDATIDGGGEGTLVRVTFGPTTIRGLRLRGSGDSLLGEDAAVRVERAPGCVVDHNRITDTLFGVLVIAEPRLARHRQPRSPART